MKKYILTVIFCFICDFAMPEFLSSLGQIEGLEMVREDQMSYASDLVFSPNGRNLAFISRGVENPDEIKVLDTDTWQLVNIGHHTTESYVEWVTDDIIAARDRDVPARNFISLTAGEMITDETTVADLRNQPKGKVTASRKHLYDITGSDRVSLLDNGKEFLVIRDINEFTNLRVSTSRNLITFSGIVNEEFKQEHSLGGIQGIFLYDRNTNRLKLIEGDLASHSCFSADEKFLLYESTSISPDNLPGCEDETYLSSLWIMDIASGERKQLSEYKRTTFYCLAWSSNGLICFTREGHPDVTQLGFYRLKLKQSEQAPTPN